MDQFWVFGTRKPVLESYASQSLEWYRMLSFQMLSFQRSFGDALFKAELLLKQTKGTAAKQSPAMLFLCLPAIFRELNILRQR